MGDPYRFEAFARFLRRTFPAATTVADVAGGHGELSFWLGELGLRPVIIDPRPATLPRWIHRILRKRAVRSGRRAGIERLLARVEEVDLRPFDLVAALHPDAATEPAVRAAVAQGVDFAVVPCCVFPLDGVKRSREEWLSHLAALAPGARVGALPIGGANAVLWWRARKEEPDETQATGVAGVTDETAARRSSCWTSRRITWTTWQATQQRPPPAANRQSGKEFGGTGR